MRIESDGLRQRKKGLGESEMNDANAIRCIFMHRMIRHIAKAHSTFISISRESLYSFDDLANANYTKIEDRLISLGFLSLPKKFN